jgi:rhodanese-related sulfurtransferase
MFEELSPEAAMQKFTANQIVMIDVRNPVEFALERIKGALNAPLNTLDPAKLPVQDGKPIVLICGSGVRSGKAAKMCLEAGLGNIMHVIGGMNAWKMAKLETAAINPMTGNMTV